MLVRITVLLVTGMLLSCNTKPPIPVSDISSQAPAEQRDESTATTPPVRATNQATTSLLAQAEAAQQSNAPDRAITYLERAVRLDPRNPALWTTLAKSHLANGNLVSANQYVRKAIALANDDSELSRVAWLALADIRDAEGQNTEATSIRRRYSRARG